jgi:hypothetical protein
MVIKIAYDCGLLKPLYSLAPKTKKASHGCELARRSDLYRQLRRNNIPVTTRGPAINRYVDNGNLPQAPTTYSMPSTMKRIPPIHSRRQENTSTPMMTNVGMRCIRRARLVAPKPLASSKTSSANRLVKAANTIQSVLGAQYNNCCADLSFRDSPTRRRNAKRSVMDPMSNRSIPGGLSLIPMMNAITMETEPIASKRKVIFRLLSC